MYHRSKLYVYLDKRDINTRQLRISNSKLCVLILKRPLGTMALILIENKLYPPPPTRPFLFFSGWREGGGGVKVEGEMGGGGLTEINLIIYTCFD